MRPRTPPLARQLTLPVRGLTARPFLKWAGGKSGLISELVARLPAGFAAYHEPCLGGGALFFELAARGRLARAFLSDVNAPLIETYRAVARQAGRVIVALRRHRNEREYYYAVRALDPARLSLAERAARLIYLNRTCYNGLYRENRSGRFNVPFGRYANPRICDEENLRAAARALRGIELSCRRFATVLDHASPGDLVYFDPPYHPLSATSSFTAYDRDGFSRLDQCRLRDVVRELARRGVHVVVSNSNTAFIRELYAEFVIERVSANRSINSRADRRGRVTELIIRAGPGVGGSRPGLGRARMSSGDPRRAPPEPARCT